jgi:hypothetical protein
MALLVPFRSLTTWCRLRVEGGANPQGLKPAGVVHEGKDQLYVDRGRWFVVTCITAGDPLALAAAISLTEIRELSLQGKVPGVSGA